jgi:hypothetical protein
MERANELVEEVVRKEFLNDERHECASPSNPCRARRKHLQRVRTELRPPPLGIELLLRPNGGFELSIDFERDGMDRTHGSTSHGSARERRSRVVRCGGPGPPAD